MKQLGGYSILNFKSDDCSPISKKKGSCLNKKLIIKISKIINNILKKNNQEKINLKLPIEDIHNQLSKILRNI